jgi:SAM-dependent methyltransferase
MLKFKERTHRVMRKVGLDEGARKLWSRRHAVRTLCWNAGYRITGADDGLPIPPARLIHLVADSREISWFLHGGRIECESICYALHRNGLRMEDFGAILDFGCGCGRVMRYWKSLEGPHLYGTDYNAELIAWCRRNLGGLADFRTNRLSPPLDYENGAFDFIYVISVFTHLTIGLQHTWMDELARVLVPGGLLLITVHGDSRLHQLCPEQRRQFQDGQIVVKYEEGAGSNACGAYHPERYVREKMARGFDVVDFVPAGARAANQDVFLLRKLPSSSQPS